MTDKCWHRTGPVTFCGRPAEHTIHHIQPDTFRFHPFQAKPDREQAKRFVTEVHGGEKAKIEAEAGTTADRVYIANLQHGMTYIVESQTDALVRACHERNIYSPEDLRLALVHYRLDDSPPNLPLGDEP